MADTPTTPPSHPPSSNDPPRPPEASPQGPQEIPKAKIVAPSVMEGIDEDGIYELEPELAAESVRPPRASDPTPAMVAATPQSAAPAPPPGIDEFVRPGYGPPKVWASVGAVLLVCALIAVGVNSQRGATSTTATILLMLYNVLLHTGTGVVALWLASLLTEKRLGRVELAAARMFTAVAALALGVSLRVSLFTASPIEQSIWAVVIGAAAYVGAVAGLFRLWGPPLGFVVGAHLGLWLLVQVGMLLSALAATDAPKAAG